MESVYSDNQPLNVEWDKYVKVFCPHLFPYYVHAKAIGRINQQLSYRNARYSQGDPKTNGTTFYDLIRMQVPPFVSDDRSRMVSLGLLRLLDEQVAILEKHLKQTPNLRKELQEELSDLFQVNGDKYLDRVGEVVSRVYLLQQHPNLRVRSLSYCYEKAKRRGEQGLNADLYVEDTQTGERRLIDILNIQLDHLRIENEEKLGDFIRDRLIRKKAKKNFTPALYPAGFTCSIQPVIWLFDLPTEDRYRSFFQNFQEEGVLPLLHLIQKGDGRSVFFSCQPF